MNWAARDGHAPLRPELEVEILKRMIPTYWWNFLSEQRDVHPKMEILRFVLQKGKEFEIHAKGIEVMNRRMNEICD